MKIVNPIIIIGAPRSGTTLLFSILSSHPDLWSTYSESSFLERYIGPNKLGWHRGNQVSGDLATKELCQKVIEVFYQRAMNYQALFPDLYSRIYANRSFERVLRKFLQLTLFAIYKPSAIRLVEKTPRNILRIPFMNTVFPDAHFVFLIRDPRANISSLLEGWRETDRFETYEVPGGLDVAGYNGLKWNFLLPPNWEKFAKGKSLVEVCAFQYRVANQTALESLREIPDNRKSIVRYEMLVENSEETVKRLCSEVSLSYRGGTKNMAREMPPVNITGKPHREKWKKNEGDILKVLDSVRDLSNQLDYTV